MFARKLEKLRQEFAKGQQQLMHVEQQRAELRETLLRISGAIQVLQELQEEQQSLRETA